MIGLIVDEMETPLLGSKQKALQFAMPFYGEDRSSLFNVLRFKILGAYQIGISMACKFKCEVWGDSGEVLGEIRGVKVRIRGRNVRSWGRKCEVLGDVIATRDRSRVQK